MAYYVQNNMNKRKETRQRAIDWWIFLVANQMNQGIDQHQSHTPRGTFQRTQQRQQIGNKIKYLSQSTGKNKR